jgi:hypothetical protein
MPSRPPATRLLPTLVLALAACGTPPGADIPPSDYVQTSARPTLAPDSDFAAALAEAGPAAARIDAETAALAARAEALRARVEGLGAPVIDPADRERLEAAEARTGG